MNNSDVYGNKERSIEERIKKGWIPTSADMSKMSSAELNRVIAALDVQYAKDLESLAQLGRDAGVNLEEDARRAANQDALIWDSESKTWTTKAAQSGAFRKARTDVEADNSYGKIKAVNCWDPRKKRWILQK